MTEAMVAQRAIFISTHEALAFAFNRVSYPPGPLMNRLAGGGRPEGRGLSGEEGAGNAGLILRRLQALIPLHRAVLRAQYGPATRECSCCGQDAPHHEWVSSMRVIADHAVELFTTMPSVSEALVYALVSRHFSRDKTPLEIVGARCCVSLSTSSRANGELKLWLRGARRSKIDGIDIGVEARAFAEADSLLVSGGFIRP